MSTLKLDDGPDLTLLESGDWARWPSEFMLDVEPVNFTVRESGYLKDMEGAITEKPYRAPLAYQAPGRSHHKKGKR